MYIVMLGAPGSGKGTMGKILSEDLKLAHISTGDLFRENLKNGTELGKKAKEYMNKGELVPDEITIKMLEERLKQNDAKNGAILDGFPRTKKQAICLDKILNKMETKVDIVINLTAPFDELVERITNRRNCRNCPAVYNIVSMPPKKEGICDKCGGELYQREDQKPEIVCNRLKVYNESAQELINYYKNAEVLHSIETGKDTGKTILDIAQESKKVCSQ